MGPNPLWLMEELVSNLELRPGMKVLDLGCGKAITSIFLAKEFGVTVFANDLWISANDNFKRIKEAGVENLVFPIHAEAHALPYADGFFDVVISMDSYQYFGTDEMFFPQVYSKLVKKGGQLAIAVPGFKQEFERGYPDSLEKYWTPDMFTFHDKSWWRKLWYKTNLVEITSCYHIDDIRSYWEPWAIYAKDKFGFNDLEFINADKNNDLTFIIMTARTKI